MSFMFEKREVYQETLDFADSACALTESFPRGYRDSTLFQGMNRLAGWNTLDGRSVKGLYC